MVTEKAIGNYLLKNIASPLDKIIISKAMRSVLISVAADSSINIYAKITMENNISSLVVMDDTTVNIPTKSDFVRLYAERVIRERLVKDFMTEIVITITPSNSLRWALVLMIRNKISILVVT